MKSKKLVVLSGAGVSAESGLQTFRDGDGLWENHRIEDVATPQAFSKNPQLVLDFYNYRRRQLLQAHPNRAHQLLAELQQHFDVHIITQNIDDLHERAGSKKVLHLHGELLKMRSVKDDRKIFSCRDDMRLGDCAEDGGQLRPHIVWFGESVPEMEQAASIVAEADIFVVIGTSLLVYPAAFLAEDTAPNIERYIIDKKIPYVKNLESWFCIEQPATIGMEQLYQLLLHSGDDIE